MFVIENSYEFAMAYECLDCFRWGLPSVAFILRLAPSGQTEPVMHTICVVSLQFFCTCGKVKNIILEKANVNI